MKKREWGRRRERSKNIEWREENSVCSNCAAKLTWCCFGYCKKSVGSNSIFHVLIVGAFHIHVYCPEKPMANDFLNLMDFILIIHKVRSGHCLNLVTYFGFPVFNIETRVLVFFLFVCFLPVLLDK